MSNRSSAMRRLVAVTGLLAICLGASSKSYRLISDNIENRETSATVEFSTTRTFDFVVVRASTAEVVRQT